MKRLLIFSLKSLEDLLPIAAKPTESITAHTSSVVEDRGTAFGFNSIRHLVLRRGKRFHGNCEVFEYFIKIWPFDHSIKDGTPAIKEVAVGVLVKFDDQDI